MSEPGRSPALLVAGTALFVLLLPLQVAGTVPWLLSRWQVRPAFWGCAPVLRYAAVVAAGFHFFVLLHEEPSLRRRFGAEYEAYCRGVRRWRPRLTPWTGTPRS